MEDQSAIAKKKVLVMTLGNAKDVNALIDLLHSEENQEVRCHIVTVLAALGKVEVIDHLKQIYKEENRVNVKDRIDEAINVIQGLSDYVI